MTRTVAIGLALALLASACASSPDDVASDSSELGSAKERLACTDPPLRDCSFYASCLEADHPCGPDGYALGYGERYCRRFLVATGFSEEGLAWRDQTMVCLQRRLGRFLGDAKATCDAIVEGAFDDHPACYTQPGATICDLPPSDWIQVVDTIDAGDLLGARGRKQIAATARACLTHWTRGIWRHPGTVDVARALEQDPDVPTSRLRALVVDATR